MSNKAPTKKNDRTRTDITIILGLTATILFFAATGFVSYWNTRVLNHDSLLVSHTHEVITNLDGVITLLTDAETGQRGYVITGIDSYLEPYISALGRIESRIKTIEQLTEDNPDQQARIPMIKANIKVKLDELAQTIALRREKGFDAARTVVVTDRGKNSMDQVRTIIADMRQEERDLRIKRVGEMAAAYRVAVVSGVMTGLLGIILSIAIALLLRRAAIIRKQQEWLQTGQSGLAAAMLGDQRVEKLGENILKFLGQYFDAHAGAFFVREGNIYRRVATTGIPENSKTPESFRFNEGLLGQAAKDGKAVLMHDIPEGYLSIGSALGQGVPRHLVISPSTSDEGVNAVIELGFVHPLDTLTLQLLNEAAESIGVAVRAANYRNHLQNLLEETQKQAEELQAQGEELRVSNEELEEQSRALKESQSRLEQQQAELEQTNSQLEEQAQLLETQKDDLLRAKSSIQVKAQELEQSSQYKSDFLANMSHELRTPLNSSLILAKLLADNPAGNLSAEQVKFAKTIQNSGNDLLALINDILDLSKIEAGHMEMRPEQVSLERMVKDITSTFDPMAKQKGLVFKTKIIKGSPETIETDRQRLEQILKNLLSNAIKFTSNGNVDLSVYLAADNKIEFAVTDTGIGIPPEQQLAIFDAFRQADGTISRKYGGTGLGLSISRELARLLGGAITLKSEAGQGSTFTITIPATYDATKIASQSSVAPSAAKQETPSETKALSNGNASTFKLMDDDRDKLVSQKHTILVIEDDLPFARILYDLAHELGFQCLVSHTAEDGLVVAKQYLPHAVILDVGLPDYSGLSVLDRLKRNTHTRHIPVHVVSATDYTQKALSLGAVGHMMKPVKRNELVEAMKKMENTFSHHVRRVLVVEDDPVQLDSVRKLLGSHDVETVGAGTVAECLSLLKDGTFDCMVLDLSLPDASGYSLLETLSKEDAYSFPPVIVYTGRDLTEDQEQRLRRYSKSIIIKGAKSPERLLDEVTLFLHQVVSELPAEQQRMLENAKNRDAVLEGRRILVVEDDVANVYALTSILEPRGALVQIARNGREALEMLKKAANDPIDLVLMDMMMPEVDGLTATREIRKNAEWKKLPVIMITAKAMKDDQERCMEAGANDYMAKPLDVEKLLSLVRVWMPR